jgi:hypothetical protein
LLGVGDDARALPVVRIIAPDANYDYQNKYFTNDTQYLCPSNLPPEQEKQIQEYLALLRAYLATQTVALSNLYQLYAERQAIDPDTVDPALRSALHAVASQTPGPLSRLKLENFMATRRILDKNWYKNDLLNENPATLQRQQIELLAENLAESYQTRMTLERLLATMSVLVLELNGQARTQLEHQVESINNPN